MIQALAVLPLLAISADVVETNKQIVRRIYEEAINNAKLELLDATIADSYVGERGDQGPPSFRATVEGLRRGFPDIRFTVEELIGEGDRVVIRWTWTGTHSGPFRELAPTGKSVKNSGIAIYTLRDGKVVASKLESDRLGVLQQLGQKTIPQR